MMGVIIGLLIALVADVFLLERTLSKHLKKIGDHMANIDTTTQDLTGLLTVGDGLVSLLGTLNQEIRDLKSAGTDPETAAKIDALDQKITDKTTEWAAAIAANTAASGDVTGDAGTGTAGSDTSAGTGAGGTAPATTDPVVVAHDDGV